MQHLPILKICSCPCQAGPNAPALCSRPQQGAAGFPVRQIARDERVKLRAVVHIAQVRQLMHDDVVDRLRRVLHQPPRKADVPLRAAAAKARARARDAHLRRAKTHPLGIIRHTLRQIGFRLPDVRLPLGIRRLRVRGGAGLLFGQSARDPVGVRRDKAVDHRLRRPARRAHDHAPAAHLERQRAPAGANEFIRLHGLPPLCATAYTIRGAVASLAAAARCAMMGASIL